MEVLDGPFKLFLSTFTENITHTHKTIALLLLLYYTKKEKKRVTGNRKSPSANAKGLEIDNLPSQDDFRNFCMDKETEKVYNKLEEVIGIC